MLDYTCDKLFVHCVAKAVGRLNNGDPWIWEEAHQKALIAEFERYLQLFQGIHLMMFSVLNSHIHFGFYLDNKLEVDSKSVADAYQRVYGREIDRRTAKFIKLHKNQSNLSLFMQRFNREFARRFNIEHFEVKRDGHMWGKRFHSTLILDAEVLLRVFSYNMFNPVKAGLSEHPQDYPFNSFHFANEAKRNKWLASFHEAYEYLSNSEVSRSDFEQMLEDRLLEDEQRIEKERRKSVKAHYQSNKEMTLTEKKRLYAQVVNTELDKQRYLSHSNAIGSREKLEEIMKTYQQKFRISATDIDKVFRC